MGAEASTVTGAEQVEDSELQARIAKLPPPSWESPQVEAKAPSARECVAVCGSLAGRESMLILAGRGADSAHNDVATYDASACSWSAVVPSGTPPPARSGHTAVHVPGVGVILHGGASEETGFLSDTALLLCGDGPLQWATLRVEGEAPCARDKHTAVLVPPTLISGAAGGAASAWRMITFGGFGVLPEGEGGNSDGEDEEDERESDEEEPASLGPEAGAIAQDAEPSLAHTEPSLADKLRAKADVAARTALAQRKARGPALKLGWFDDAHQLTFDGPGRWARLVCDQPKSETPMGRAAHGACWFGGTAGVASAQGASILVFGGRTSEGRVNDTWLLDVPSTRWRAPVCTGRAPCARSFHSVTRVGTQCSGVAAIFGGLDAGSRHLADLHLLVGASLAWACVPTVAGPSGPPAGRGSAAVAALADGTLLVFGGSSGWDAAQGGPTRFHADLHTIQLAPLLAEAVLADVQGQAAPQRDDSRALPGHAALGKENAAVAGATGPTAAAKKARLGEDSRASAPDGCTPFDA